MFYHMFLIVPSVRDRMVSLPMCQFIFETQRTMVSQVLIVTRFEYILIFIISFSGTVQNVVKKDRGKSRTKMTRMINQKNRIFCCVYYI